MPAKLMSHIRWKSRSTPLQTGTQDTSELCDLDLWPYGPKTGPVPECVKTTTCTKFGVPKFNRFWLFPRKDILHIVANYTAISTLHLIITSINVGMSSFKYLFVKSVHARLRKNYSADFRNKFDGPRKKRLDFGGKRDHIMLQVGLSLGYS